MITNGNFRALDTYSPLPERNNHTWLAPGDAVRRAATGEHQGETGIVVRRGLFRTKVRWTSGETTVVARAQLRRIKAREPIGGAR